MRRPEQELQRQVVQLLQIHERRGALVYLHVPNGGKRDPVEGAIFQGLGVRPGAPDLLIFHGSRMRPACFGLELKAPGEKASEAQRDFAGRLDRHGVPYYVADTLEDVSEILKDEGIG